VEVETTLLDTASTVQNMILMNAAKQEILDCLTNTTEWIQSQERRLFAPDME
jgi:hypothetical protein